MSETKPEETISEAPADKPKAKLHTIMEAASALTSLGDEESENETSPASASKDAAAAEEAEDAASDDSKPQKRYLPDYKKPDAAPTFPEKVSAAPWRPPDGPAKVSSRVRRILRRSYVASFG